MHQSDQLYYSLDEYIPNLATKSLLFYHFIIQSLLLFSRSIDTNGSFSRMVFDQWLELRFAHPIEAQEMMWRAARLRATWQVRLHILYLMDLFIIIT